MPDAEVATMLSAREVHIGPERSAAASRASDAHAENLTHVSHADLGQLRLPSEDFQLLSDHPLL